MTTTTDEPEPWDPFRQLREKRQRQWSPFPRPTQPPADPDGTTDDSSGPERPAQ